MKRADLVLISMAAVGSMFAAGVEAFDVGQTHSVYASSVAGISPAGESGVLIQNLDRTEYANICADFYRSAGPWIATINLPPTKPGTAASLWVPGTSIPAGEYAVRAIANRQIAAIARTDWPASGGAALYSNVIPGNNIAVPLAVRNFHGQCSIVSVQNMDAGAPAQVTLDVFESGAASPKVSHEYGIPAGTSITMDLCTDDAEFADLGNGFLGSIHVTSATEVGVVSFVDITTSEKAVYAFEGLPDEMASPTLYVPLFRAVQRPRASDPSSGRIDTGISVTNPGESSVDVTVTYLGAGGTCAGETVTSPPATIAPNSSHVFYQGAPAGQGLKEGCYGSAVIQSSGGGILAIVNEALNLNEASAAYNAMSAEQGALDVALPLYRNQHANGLTTGISAMNVGTGDAQITVSFIQQNPNGTTSPVNCGAPCTKTVGANQTAIFWPAMMADIPRKTYGSATILSTQPVVVIVNDVNVTGVVDMATYNGIKADSPPETDGFAGLPRILVH